MSTPEIDACSYFTPFWLVGSLYWCCQGFCSLAAGRAGLGEGRTWFKESRQQHPGIQMKSSSWEWLQLISCKLQAGQCCILPGFVFLWSSQVVYRLNTGTWSSKVVGIFVIIIEDFGSNL